MAYLALARKWRPRQFADVVGQATIVRALENALATDKLHHALLFSGTRGVGKTTLARIIARGLNCEHGPTATPCGECGICLEIDDGRHLDLLEVDAASRTKVDDTRELLDNVQYAPTRGRYKVYLIDEVHMLSGHSFNALLKTLEEPPAHVKFILATTDPQKLPITILSRCLQFHLKRMTVNYIESHFEKILISENINFEKNALSLLARAADGSMRDGLSLLDQAIACGLGVVESDVVQTMLGNLSQQDVGQLLHALAAHDASAMWACLQQWRAQAADPAQILDTLAAMLQRVALIQQIPSAIQDFEDSDPIALQNLVAAFSPEEIQLYYEICVHGRRDLPYAPEPFLGLEMTALRLLAFKPHKVGAPIHAAPAQTPIAQPISSNIQTPNISKNISNPNISPKQIAAPRVAQIASTPEMPSIPHNAPKIISNNISEKIPEKTLEKPVSAIEKRQNASTQHTAAEAALAEDAVFAELQAAFGASMVPNSMRVK